MGAYIIHFDDKPWHDLDDELYYRCFEIPWFSTTDTTISRLTPYTEPDIDAIRKEAYYEGYETGYEDGYNEPGKEKIQVGDEVGWNGDRYVVTYIDVDEAHVDVIDCSCGSVCDRLVIKGITKTGRHFPEIAEVLAKMREN